MLPYTPCLGRERRESALIKIWIRAREGNVKFDDLDTSTLKRGRSMNLDKIAAILDKDGGLLNVGVVEQLGLSQP